MESQGITLDLYWAHRSEQGHHQWQVRFCSSKPQQSFVGSPFRVFPQSGSDRQSVSSTRPFPLNAQGTFKWISEVWYMFISIFPPFWWNRVQVMQIATIRAADPPPAPARNHRQ